MHLGKISKRWCFGAKSVVFFLKWLCRRWKIIDGRTQELEPDELQCTSTMTHLSCFKNFTTKAQQYLQLLISKRLSSSLNQSTWERKLGSTRGHLTRHPLKFSLMLSKVKKLWIWKGEKLGGRIGKYKKCWNLKLAF